MLSLVCINFMYVCGWREDGGGFLYVSYSNSRVSPYVGPCRKTIFGGRVPSSLEHGSVRSKKSGGLGQLYKPPFREFLPSEEVARSMLKATLLVP